MGSQDSHYFIIRVSTEDPLIVFAAYGHFAILGNFAREANSTVKQIQILIVYPYCKIAKQQKQLRTL